MKVLIVRTADSPPTFITSFFGAKIANFLRNEGFEVTEIVDWIRSSKLGWWWAKKYDLILYLGHGETDKLLGNIYLGLVLPFLDMTNIPITRNKIIITYACLSAKKLGKYAVKYSKAYTGSDYFMYVAFPEEIDYASFFYEPFQAMIRDFINGKTIGESVETYKSIAMRNALRIQSFSSPEAQVYANYLMLNAKHYQVLGDASLSL